MIMIISKMKIVQFIALFLILTSNCLSMNKEEHIRSIFDKIIYHVDDGKAKPEFVFLRKDKQVDSKCKKDVAAWICPDDGKIFIDEWLYDFLKERFPDTYQHALSYIISHEVAHFYKHTKEGKAFFTHGIAYSKSFQEHAGEQALISIEREADIIGGMYSFMAGYDIRKIKTSFMQPLYDTLAAIRGKTPNDFDKGLVDGRLNYFSLAERDSIHHIIIDSLTKLIGIYEAGNMLYITGNYEDAAKCFEHILYFFPSKEIYNNLGVCYAEMAMKEAGQDIAIYKFPFTFELETEISQIVTKGITSNTKKARGAFQMAIARDNHNWKAYINLASIYVIEEQYDSTFAILDEIKPTLHNPNEIADMNIVRGIAYAVSGKKAEARNSFESAKIHNSKYSEFNINALDGKSNPKATKREYLEILKEMVCETSLISNPRIMGERKTISTPFSIFFVAYETDNCKAIANQIRKDKRNESNKYYFLTARNQYENSTNLGIKLFDESKKLENIYGEPDFLHQSDEFIYWVYTYDTDNLNRSMNDKFIDLGIVFKVNKENNLVVSWILYYNKKG